jgi:hypothetical protein
VARRTKREQPRKRLCVGRERPAGVTLELLEEKVVVDLARVVGVVLVEMRTAGVRRVRVPQYEVLTGAYDVAPFSYRSSGNSVSA